MMSKLKSLRNCPVLRQKEILEEVDAKTFRHLKYTPQVKEKLKAIEKLDNDIKETIAVYKMEKLQRLQTQNEMCNDISRSNSFTDGQLFLELCHFEGSDDTDDAEPTDVEVQNSNNSAPVNQQKDINCQKNFIKRNIQLAKEGIMAGCSLTDEEKKKLEDLLAESDGPYSLEDHGDDDSKQRDININFSHESDDDSDGDNYYISNAYVIDVNQKKRVEDINSELEKFTLDETEKEKIEDTTSKYDKVDWNSVLVEQRMKLIDAKLNEIRKSFRDDEAKDDQNSSEETGNDSEVSDSTIIEESRILCDNYEYNEIDDQIASQDIVNISVAEFKDSEK